ncbi:polyketide synthase dehydratase domain-containing protein, partial [Thermoactinospora rubra]|uniref:polyketide synthase dehydratase domain-containing protein n=1 Tax=Thermoactinospora rubra TaxID=1088767 RepID=UPI003B847097
MLAAVVATPDDGTVTLTGQLSRQTHPWLAGHAVHGTVIVPGTGLVELALRAGREVGATGIEELTLEAPMVIPETGTLAVQVNVGEPDEHGRRSVRIHSRPEGGEWRRHAAGFLAESDTPGAELTEWPPPAAQPLDVADAYDELADRGYAYGETFQALKAAWRRGEEVYAEVALPEDADT